MTTVVEISRQLQHSRNYQSKHRDVINERARLKYLASRDEILAKRKAKRTVPCPLCHFDFCNRPYLKRHMITRHKLTVEQVEELLSSPQDLVGEPGC